MGIYVEDLPFVDEPTVPDTRLAQEAFFSKRRVSSPSPVRGHRVERMSFPYSSLVQHCRVNSLCLILIWSKCGFSADIGEEKREGIGGELYHGESRLLKNPGVVMFY